MITGASRGLGRGLAERLAERGAAVGLCARTEPAAPPSASAGVVTASADVTDAAAVDRFCDEVAERLGPIDVWVNNAGLLEPISPLRHADPKALSTNVAVNVTGVLLGSRAYLRHVHVRGRRGVSYPARLSRFPTTEVEKRDSLGLGHGPADGDDDGRSATLVNITSGAARNPYVGWAAYCASKAAVDQLSRVIAAEEPDVRVLALSPGLVDTDMQALIRSTDEAHFPAVERFRRAAAHGALNQPAWVADWLAHWSFGPAPEDLVVRVPDQHPA